MGTAKGTFPFNFVNPESAWTVTVSGNTLAGAQASDYVLATNEESGLTAHITPKTLYVTGLAASNKTYDGTTTATLTGTAALLSADTAGASTTDGHPYQGDLVSLAATAGADFTGTFASPNAANGIGVAVTGGQLLGGNISDYVLASTDEENGALKANITPAPVTVSIINDPSKIYDGTTTATLTAANFSAPSGTVGSDSYTLVNPPTTGSYSVATVGTTTVTATLTPANFKAGTGTLASNYALPTSATGPGAIIQFLTAPGLAIADYANDATPPTTTLATFTDAAAQAVSTNDTASINWGDGGKTTSGTIMALTNLASHNSYTVQGSHMYAQAGVYQVQVTITDGTQSTVVTLNADIGPLDTWSTTATATTNPSSPTATSLNTARSGATATLLSDNQVLVAGGTGSNGEAVSSAELYNPATGAWSATGSLNTARTSATATLLPNGQVLVAGGQDSNSNDLSSAELYNPATGIWTTTGSLTTARHGATATLLPNGLVLVAGGVQGSNNYLSSAELYNPATHLWSSTGSLNTARQVTRRHCCPTAWSSSPAVKAQLAFCPVPSCTTRRPFDRQLVEHQQLEHRPRYATATLLPNGQVLVAGGQDSHAVALSSAELYNPATHLWSSTGSLNTARTNASATLLPDGLVLVAGGEDSNDVALSSAELYNPATLPIDSWSSTGSLNTARADATATLLPNGQVLVAGGQNGSGSLASSELFEAATLRSIALSPANATLPSTASTFATGFVKPDGVAFDAAGNLYVSNLAAGTVVERTPAGVVTLFASINLPAGLAFDSNGNLYVASIGDGPCTK